MSSSMGSITLGCGESLCTVSPAAGGSITGWTVSGQPMLRMAGRESAGNQMVGREIADPRDAASFPLLPYSNRIGGGRFVHDGAIFRLSQTLSGEALPLHGIGMLRLWQMEVVTSDSLTMTLTHRGDGHWPFAFAAEQRVRVTDDGLLIAMSVTNRQPHDAPAAFGHHPYFDSAGASLRFDAQQVWSNGDDMLPIAASQPAGAFDFADGARVVGRRVDNSYTGWDGSATIDWTGRSYRLVITASSSLPVAVLYIPDAGDHFCFEPVPHLTDAINRPGCPAPMPMLGPGERFEASISLRAVPVRP